MDELSCSRTRLMQVPSQYAKIQSRKTCEQEKRGRLGRRSTTSAAAGGAD